MIIDTKNNRRILREASFDFGFSNFLKEPVFLGLIHKKQFSIGKNTEASYRIMNHWEKLGLIKSNRKENQGWRKFSIYDLVWHLVILSLRDFGFPNEKILKVKDSLLGLKTPTGSDYPIFEYYICLALSERMSISLIVYSDGFSDIGDCEEIRFTQNLGMEDHIIIDVNNLLNKIFTKDDFSSFHDLFIPLSEKELEVIKAVRAGKYESIKVKFLNGEIELLEKTEDIKTKKKIVEILLEDRFQNIEIRQKNGKIVSLKRTTKKKL